MNAKTMEGIAGAGTNMKLIETPMRVFRDARRRGDLAVMERALGYAGDFADKSREYMVKADEGMEEDAKKAREEREEEQEKAIQKRREEREKLEERLRADANQKTNAEKSADKSTDNGTDVNHSAASDTDTVYISEEGKVLLKEQTASFDTASDGTKAAVLKEAVFYTSDGKLTAGIGQR